MDASDASSVAPTRTFVIHWNLEELPAKVSLVERAGGHVVGSEAQDGARAARGIRELAPDAVVIWLSWLPSHGRVTAAAVRSDPSAKKLPILFVDGDPEPVPPATLARVKAAVQGALFVTPASLRLWLGKVAALRDKASREHLAASDHAATENLPTK